MATLFELTGDYKKLEQMFDEETDPDTLEAILDTFEGADIMLEQKADNYAKLISNIEGENLALDDAIKGWQKRKRINQNKIKSLKNRLELSMRMTGKTKFATDFFSFGIQKNGGKRKLTLKVAPMDLPEEFRECVYKPNDSEIRKAIKKDDIEETDYWKLEPQSESLRIRGKVK